MTYEEKTKLFNDNYKFICWYTLKIYQSFNLKDSEDAIQQAAMYVWQYLDRYDSSKAKVSVYMKQAILWGIKQYALQCGVYGDSLRTRPNPMKFSDIENNVQDGDINIYLLSKGVIGDKSPEEYYLEKEFEPLVIKALRGIKTPAKKKEMFKMYYHLGKYKNSDVSSGRDVAKKMKCSRQWVQMGCKEIEQKLRESKYIYNYNIYEPYQPKPKKTRRKLLSRG